MSGRIVVGVDGSSASVAALRWAVAEAQLRGATVEALSAWSYPYVDAGLGGAPLQFDPAALQAESEALLRQAIDEAGLDGAQRALVTAKVAEGRPGDLLLEAGKGADLLVVGSRSHSGLVGALLGSVSTQVAHHATIPVVIVPPPPED